MSPTYLLVWSLTVFGITNVVTKSNIKPLTYLQGKWQVFRCSMCFGFWVGLGLFFWFSPTGWMILDGFMASSICWILFGLTEYLLKDKDY